MEINQQSILKAFYLFDKNKLFLAERPGVDRISQRKAMAAEWLDAFCTLPVETWEDATALAIKKNKNWPTVEQMWGYINDSMEPKPAELEQLDIAPQPPKRPASKLSTAEKLKRMIELAKRGDFTGARESVGVKSSIDRNEYVQQHWPDAAQRIASSCQDELNSIVRQEEICQHCPGLKHCKSRGYRTVGYIEKITGMLGTRMVPCKERREIEK